MIRARFAPLALVLFAGCGGDPPIIYLPDQQPNPMNTNMDPPGELNDFGNRIFEFSEASVFGIYGSFKLEVGAFAGTPKKASFLIRSNSGSDEASGELILGTGCTFNVAASSFPGNAKVQPAAAIASACTFDAEKAELHLPDSTTGVDSVSMTCDLPDDAGPCIPEG